MKEFLAICSGMVLSGNFWVLGLENDTAWAFFATGVVYAVFVMVEAGFRCKHKVKGPWNLIGFREILYVGFCVVCSNWVEVFWGLFIGMPAFAVGAISYFGSLFWGWMYLFFLYNGVEIAKNYLKERAKKEIGSKAKA